ncbi:hypothetical protein G4O51_09930 [Candidatus Bathyarchaeota archaeon A05DMB-2]|jgi:cell division protein FtsB|nr:hypothetical protein [Candidatus Bathyarchaeota archaeon A05DMB-2]
MIGEIKNGSERKWKKVVSRTITIALGAICIVLAAVLVIALVLYTPMVADQQSSDLQAQLADKDSQIASLTSQVSSLAAQVASLQNSLDQSYSASEVRDLLGNYSQQIVNYEAIISLSKSVYLAQNAPVTMGVGGTASIFSDYLGYAGYVGVQVESNSSTTYARVMYTLPVTEQIFDYNVTVGASGLAVFPVLPGPISVEVGNMEPIDIVNATVTAIYYY